MNQPIAPRREIGDAFFDAAFYECYDRLNYSRTWLDEGRAYGADDAYVVSHPSWFLEPMPAVADISIYDLFAATAARCPDDTAVVFFDKPATYRELKDLVNRHAALLQSSGVKAGDVVAAMLPNSLQHIVAFFGAAQIGAVHTPINVMYQADEVAHQIRDSGARTIVILDLLYDRVKPLVADQTLANVITTNIRDWAAPDAVVSQTIRFLWDIPKIEAPGAIDWFAALQRQAPLETAAPCHPKTDMALLLYTAGTTGRSKGVIETHFNLVLNAMTHTHAFRAWGDREINFSIMPMFHTAGYFLHLLPVIYQGGTVVPIPMFDLADAFRIIQAYRINVIFAPPTLFIALMSRQDLLESHDISSLKVTIACGAPVPVAVQARWLELTGARLVNGWGMTETNSGGIISIPGIKEKSEAIGIPVYSEAKIVNTDGGIVKRNEEGEIYYRGLQLARGYLNLPEITAATFLKDGWFRTGDRGFIDDEDFVHFVDRIKDLIVASGYNIAPVEVENVLYKHPAVAEVAVIGVPHPYRGETVKAVVALKPESVGKVDEDELIAFCKERLATFKVPRQVEFRQALPKSAVGKILRRVLRDEVVRPSK